MWPKCNENMWGQAHTRTQTQSVVHHTIRWIIFLCCRPSIDVVFPLLENMRYRYRNLLATNEVYADDTVSPIYWETLCCMEQKAMSGCVCVFFFILQRIILFNIVFQIAFLFVSFAINRSWFPFSRNYCIVRWSNEEGKKRNYATKTHTILPYIYIEQLSLLIILCFQFSLKWKWNKTEKKKNKK